MDDSDDNAAIAAAMGFSSFGGQKANKRRKFNPGGDETTGSNMTPLGVRNTQNTDEIDLDMDDEDEEDTPAAGLTNTTDFEPQYLDTSRPSAPLHVDQQPPDEVQTKIDTIVQGIALPPGLPTRPPNISRREDRSGTKSMWWESYYDPAFIVNPWDKLEKSNGLEPRGPWKSWDEAKAATV
ncbi:hypothetical protein GGS20DRAFT_499121 [Poronia punctata]|nr:hypothetical protein GGS20DRAFT_499121 [Poronia punctata]